MVKNVRLSFEIPYVKLNFYAEILEDTRMPVTKTAALRGGMGEMLLRQNCVSDRNCESCRFQKACVVRHTFYSYMEKKPAYVTGKESVGYLIECRDFAENFSKGSIFNFSLILFGESIVFFNIFLQALSQLGMMGIGKWKSRFWIKEVRNAAGECILCENQVDMRQYHIETVSDYILRRKKELTNRAQLYTMTFVSPLCMKYQQTYMKKFYSEAIVKGSARRVQMLDYYIEIEAELPDFADYPKIRNQSVKFETVKRYSSTQDSQMILKGISGRIVLEGIQEDCLDCLIAGELIHIGKNISFGFGQYVLDSY